MSKDDGDVILLTREELSRLAREAGHEGAKAAIAEVTKETYAGIGRWFVGKGLLAGLSLMGAMLLGFAYAKGWIRP